MAEKKKAGSTKKAPSKQTSKKTKTNNRTAPSTKAPQRDQKRMNKAEILKKERDKIALILMAVAVIFLAATLIKGEHLWLGIHNGFFGLFGITAFVWPLSMIYLAIIISCNYGTLLKSKLANIIGASSFVMLLSGVIHLCSNASGVGNLGTQISFVWNNRDSVLSSAGGFFGALIGGGAQALFGKTAALVVLIVIMIVVFMLVTGTTIMGVAMLLKNAFGKAKNVSEKIKGTDADDEYDDGYVPKTARKPIPDFGSDFIDHNDVETIQIDEVVGNETKKPLRENKKEPGKIGKGAFVDISTGEVVEPEVVETPVADISSLIQNSARKKSAPKVKVAEKPAEPKEEKTADNNSDPTFKKTYQKPTVDCLKYANNSESADYEAELKYNATKLVDTLNSFGVSTKIVGICRGPSVTRYELQPAAGVKISKITGLADDLALALASSGVRIEAPIPNKSAVGIEVPNKNRSTVSLREIIETPVYGNAKGKLNVALGKDITGNTICADIAKMPHLLIAGTTGSGKSVCLNAMIVSILFNATPDEVKLVMIDPKQVEFTIYNGIPHLLVPVVSDPRKAAGALGWAVTEMLQRYKMFSEKSVRDIKGYNRLAETDETVTPMPHIVIFIDELSDLMMAAPNEVEDSICRLAQMARAAGMHLVIATQRPSVNVITGIIKANIPSRIALSVSSQVDSRTILDTAGAEKLLGNGDMLFGPLGIAKPVRVQGCYLSDEEVENVVKFIKSQSEEDKKYDESVMQEIERQAAMEHKKSSVSDASAGADSDGEGADEMLPKAIEVVVEAQMASTTLLQRKLKLGYARAARIVDELEQRQIVGPFEGSKPRKVLISKQQWLEMNAMGNASAPVENPIETDADDSYEDYEDDEE